MHPETSSQDETASEGGCGCGQSKLVFDETGEIVEDTTSAVPVIGREGPCPLATLNGSWLLEITPRPPATSLNRIRGPMRIEVADTALRVSGDIYARRVTVGNVDNPADGEIPVGRRPWYPQLPIREYSWYFRAVGSTYASGTLTVNVERHVWDNTTRQFTRTDTGTLVLTCRRSLLTLPVRPQVMRGSLRIGGRTFVATATKTSNLYRGCRVEVDVMKSRKWPVTATHGGAAVTFRDIYLSAGWDVTAHLDEPDVPEDASLTNAELQTLLAGHRGAGRPDEWRLWILIGSAQGGLFGVMFDDDSVPREGVVGFADVKLGGQAFIEATARNQPLDDVPLAFLRTLTHEAGHAFNLFHPKHDEHHPPAGTEIMNQTGDVMGFASPATPYPDNATFAFAEHDRQSLIHSPDPQVRPGWLPFGWGHGNLSAGLPTPVDIDGPTGDDGLDGMRLDLTLPAEVFVGEYVIAEVSLVNDGQVPRTVTTRLNLSEGDLRLLQETPSGDVEQVRDVVVACGPRPTTVLEPGQSLTGRMQVFFTGAGVTFDRSGPYRVVAELDLDGVHTVRSARMTVRVRSAATDDERAIALTTLDRQVGMALALGDLGADQALADRIDETARAHAAGHDTGAALALVLANAHARRHLGVREPDPAVARGYLDLASAGRSADQVLALAVTVACPTERDAPVVRDALAVVRGGGEEAVGDGAADQTVGRAEEIANDFMAPSPR